MSSLAYVNNQIFFVNLILENFSWHNQRFEQQCRLQMLFNNIYTTDWRLKQICCISSMVYVIYELGYTYSRIHTHTHRDTHIETGVNSLEQGSVRNWAALKWSGDQNCPLYIQKFNVLCVCVCVWRWGEVMTSHGLSGLWLSCVCVCVCCCLYVWRQWPWHILLHCGENFMKVVVVTSDQKLLKHYTADYIYSYIYLVV